MNDRELLELIATQVGTLTNDMDEVKTRLGTLEKTTLNLEETILNLEKTTLRMEQDHGNKLEALFDGYKQNTEKLSRIEAEVVKHEEFIMKRIK